MTGYTEYCTGVALLVLIATSCYVGMTSASEPGFSLTNGDFDRTGFTNDSTLRNSSFENCTSAGLVVNITSNVSRCLESDSGGTAYTYSKPVGAVYATLCLGIWSVVANSLPLAAIIKHEHLHTPAYILMANLAASDVMTGVDFVYTETIPSIAMTRLRFKLVLLSGLSSAYSLLVLTAERYWFIVHGMTYVNNVTNDKYKVMIIIVWVWSVLLAMLPNFGWSCGSRAAEGCLSLGGGLMLGYVVLVLVFIFIPMAAVVYFNLGIFWCL
ncbi:lysophosphatidic acid receptor 3-like [Branchiostoma lanceolatum]|uniref:lysophosphatidic acid receptor 3-like n=1 Tax=Branchiostoma lanceolatum TaxID=7740 RepID=UPI003456CCCA